MFPVFGIGEILKFIFNPKVLMVIAALAVVAFFMFTVMDNAKLKTTLKDKQDEISQLQTDVGALKDGQQIQRNDIQRLDDIAKYKQTIVVRERDLDSRTNDIPDTSNDTPFADTNNMLYADSLRQFQLEALKDLDGRESQ